MDLTALFNLESITPNPGLSVAGWFGPFWDGPLLLGGGGVTTKLSEPFLGDVWAAGD